MQRYSRRAFVGGSVALTGLGAGCLSGGSETPTPAEFGTIAESSTPTERPLPSPVAGDPDADVTVAAYEDYACGHCKTYSLEIFPGIATDYLEPGTVRYEFHDFPIPVDSTASWQAANAARAVQDLAGAQAYFEYSEALFRDQSELGPDTYASLASEVGVDGATVRAAATEERYDRTVGADKRQGENLGVTGTPSVYVDGSKVEQLSYDTLSDAIESARSG